MKILMLGWEYPPQISGGLGTACQGLTTSLAALGVKIDFVVPKLYGKEHAPHMTLIDSYSGAQKPRSQKLKNPGTEGNINVLGVPSMLSPYCRPEEFDKEYEKWIEFAQSDKTLSPAELEAIIEDSLQKAGGDHYGSTLFAEVDRYTRNVVALGKNRTFDLIHCHDWMTYPAALALARISQKPLISHVHSLEYDRSSFPNRRIHAIEAGGTKGADVVIAVSKYTKNIVNAQHGVPLEKIAVVHNGVYAKEVVNHYRDPSSRTKIVLFLGRVTFQKGPEYFVDAAAKVVPYMPDVKFVVAGSGDMLPKLKAKVREMGVEKNFMFTGFLKGKEVERMYSMADLYIMPSVSEPFGIAPLEAMSYDCPVIISKQSGVSEVLNCALKVDFWDVDKMAHLIIGILRYPEIREDIVGMAKDEVKRIHWDAAASKVFEVYRGLMARKGTVRGIRGGE
jgi:glycogen(starch) synthase